MPLMKSGASHQVAGSFSPERIVYIFLKYLPQKNQEKTKETDSVHECST